LILNNFLDDRPKHRIPVACNTILFTKYHSQVLWRHRQKTVCPFSNLLKSVFWSELFDLKTHKLSQSRSDFLGSVSLLWRKIRTNERNNKLPINWFRTRTPPDQRCRKGENKEANKDVKLWCYTGT